MLLRVLPVFGQSTKEGTTTHAAFCLVLAAFLRTDEIKFLIRDSKEDEEFSD